MWTVGGKQIWGQDDGKEEGNCLYYFVWLKKRIQRGSFYINKNSKNDILEIKVYPKGLPTSTSNEN